MAELGSQESCHRILYSGPLLPCLTATIICTLYCTSLSGVNGLIGQAVT